MSINYAAPEWGFKIQSDPLPGVWKIEVVNRGTVASTFIPVGAIAISASTTVSKVELFSKDSPNLGPGESIVYTLRLTREGFDVPGTGWDLQYFAPDDLRLARDRAIDVEIEYLGPAERDNYEATHFIVLEKRFSLSMEPSSEPPLKSNRRSFDS